MKHLIIFCFCFATPMFAYSRANYVDVTTISNSADVARIFSSLPYASTNLNVQSLSEFSFFNRKQIISQLLQKDFVVSDTNALMCIADFLSHGSVRAMWSVRTIRSSDLLNTQAGGPRQLT